MPGPSRRKSSFAHALLACGALIVAAAGAALSSPTTVQAAQPSTPGPSRTLPSAVPSSNTPAVDDGRVYGIAQVGDTMVVGGTFTSVNGRPRSGIAAFNRSTGALTSFAPKLNSYVNQVIPGLDSDTVYVAGNFTTVNGYNDAYVTELNLATGQQVSEFDPPVIGYSQVKDLILRGNRLYIAGTFTKVGGQTHHRLAALNATSGALDAAVDLQFNDHHNDSGTGVQGAVGVSDIDVTADGHTMVAIGNFKHVNGLLRDQVAVLDLTTTPVRVSPDWATAAYEPLGNTDLFDMYVRGVSLAPSGTYFIVATTGGVVPGTLCDSIARFELNVSSTNVNPTWVDQSGGDTMWGVTVTGSAAYVGGHNRWLNNPLGANTPKAGAVPSPGLAALDLKTGRRLSWNPGRVPLGVAVFALLATDDGLWLGSDTDFIGDHKYKRPKLAFFPYAGGHKLASTTLGRLPGTVFLASNRYGTNQLRSVGFNGTSAVLPYQKLSTQGIDFQNWRGAVMLDGTVFYGYTDGHLYERSFDGATFGPAIQVNPYHDPAWATVPTGVHDTPLGEYFDGALPSLYPYLPNLTGMAYTNGRLYYTLTGDKALHARWFVPDSGIVDETTVTAPSSVRFDDVDGMFITAGKLYYGSRSDGSLHVVKFTAGVAGSPITVTGPPTLVGKGMLWRNTAMFLTARPVPN
jgi:hypothetical protein